MKPAGTDSTTLDESMIIIRFVSPDLLQDAGKDKLENQVFSVQVKSNYQTRSKTKVLEDA